MREDVQNRDLTLCLALELRDVVRDRTLDVQEPAILENRDRERYDGLRCRHDLEGGGVGDRDPFAFAGPQPTRDAERHVE